MKIDEYSIRYKSKLKGDIQTKSFVYGKAT